MSAWDVSRFALLGVLLWTPLARGAVHGWPLAIAQLLTLLALGAWLWAMLRQRALEWRRTVLDTPLAAMGVLVLTQLALGNGSLRAWALAPPAPASPFTEDAPARLWLLGTAAPVHTLQAFGVFAMYAAVYVLVVNVIRDRRHLQSLINTLLLVGATLAFAGLLDYLVGESWLLVWKEPHGESRVRATFNNPDHFAAWLAMLVCLGVGMLATRRSRRTDMGLLTERLASREFRERLVRRSLPFLGIVVASVAVTFTLSRGGIMGLLLGFGGMLAVFGRLGWMRWSLALGGVFAAVTLIYSSWIGLGALVARLELDPARWLMWRATLPMLRDFPLFGVGLGAYGDVFFRYQTAALEPGRLYVSDAHNEWLQLLAETGPAGVLIAGWMAWQLVNDLLRAHLFGRGGCPVGGGSGEHGQRRDPYSVGIAVGALGAVFACCAHGLVEFPARIPANGVLAAACLGIATVAVHTRFDRQSRLLVAQWSWALGTRRMAPLALGLTALVVAAVLVPWIVRPARIEAALGPREGTSAPARIDAALAIAPGDPGALALHGQALILAARESPQLAAVQSAVAALRAALAAVPSDPFLHERLGWAYELLITADPSGAPGHLASAVVHLKRAIAMAPENASLRLSLAALAAPHATQLATSLEASRAAVARNPQLLPELAAHFADVGLADGQWLSVVPPTWPDRLELGQLLEASGRLDAAAGVYQAGLELAPDDERPVGIWMFAALLIRRGHAAAAAREVQQALRRDPRNPALLVIYGQALETQGDSLAFEVYEAAVAQAETLTDDERALPFKIESGRVRAFVARRLGTDSTVLRYRRPLARYLVQRGLWSQAGHEWDRILSQAPQDAEAHVFRGMAWEGAGAPERALEHFRQAVALDAQPNFRLRLARLSWEMEQYVQAMNEWRAVLAAEPDNVEAHLGLARAHLKEGDRLAAFQRFQQILRLVPDHPVALREIGRLTGRVR